MPTALPARNILDGTATPTTSAMKTALGGLRDYLAGLLGTTGAAVDAQTALGLVPGTTVQAYDAATAKTNAAQVFTAQQTPAGAAATATAGATHGQWVPPRCWS
jgi:hypothetical protein